MLLLFAVEGAAEEGPTNPHGFEIGRFVSFKPLLQKIMDERRKPLPTPSNKAARKRVKVIEVKAAKTVMAGAGEDKFRELMKQWVEAKPALPQAPQVDTFALFMAQVAFRLRQIEQDEEEELLALIA